MTALRPTAAPAGAPRPLLAAALAAVLAATLAGCAAPPVERVSEVRNAPEVNPDRRARARLELASAYFGRGQTGTALEEVNQALAARPDLPEAYNLRGLIYASLGETQQAEASFRRSLALAPRDGDAMHNFGWFLCQQQRFPEADAQFSAALAQPQYQDLVRTLLAQGICQARAGRLADAERTLGRSYELDPANPFTAFSLSEVLLRRGEFERARFYVRRVNALPEQTNAQTLWLAARIEHKLGNQAGTDDFGRRLRERFPQSPEAARFEGRRFDD